MSPWAGAKGLSKSAALGALLIRLRLGVLDLFVGRETQINGYFNEKWELN